MVTLRYYLDARRPSTRPDGKHSIKLAVTKRGQTALLPVMAYATREEWDQAGQRLRGRNVGGAAQLNRYLSMMMVRFEDALRELVLSGAAAPMTAYDVRDRLEAAVLETGPGISLGEYYDAVMAEKHGATRKAFADARVAFQRALPRIMEKPLVSVNDRDVARIDAWLSANLAPNTRNTYISKLTQVTKRAHREGLMQADAGRNVKIRTVIPKSRALTLEQLRTFLGAEPGTERCREALALFRLSFYLRAMNSADIARCGPADIYNGRLGYTRAKTGKDYSVRVEPEALEIIARYGDEGHLFAPLAAFSTPERYLQEVNRSLRSLAKGNGLPPVTMYWARHTFASLMIESGSTMEITAGALGHSYGPRITAGYVTLQQRQVDEAVRRVYDLVAGD